MTDDNKPTYDFDFITQALGLIPINNGSVAINPGAVTDLEREDNGDWVITLGNSSAYTLNDEDMAELEETIKQRAESSRLIQKEAIKNQMMAQAEAAVEVQNKLNSGVQPGMIVGAVPTGKRFRQ
jgi:hypothetical protein